MQRLFNASGPWENMQRFFNASSTLSKIIQRCFSASSTLLQRFRGVEDKSQKKQRLLNASAASQRRCCDVAAALQRRRLALKLTLGETTPSVSLKKLIAPLLCATEVVMHLKLI